MKLNRIVQFLIIALLLTNCTKQKSNNPDTDDMEKIKKLFTVFEVALKKNDYSLYRNVFTESSTKDDFEKKFGDNYYKNIQIMNIVFKGEQIIGDEVAFVNNVTIAADKYARDNDEYIGMIRADAVVFTPKEKSVQWKILHMITVHNE
ncbi:MAG TPA: hypothetical protein P5123_00765 [Spirochaetota bacterium]|nr:hypothetical protein [Spirochaetota bacterium]